jgi:hypothetical protein
LGVVEAARPLDGAGALHHRANVGGRLAGIGGAHLFIGHGGDFQVNIDAVEQRSADLAQIALDHAGRAAALARGVAIKPALIRIHNLA